MNSMNLTQFEDDLDKWGTDLQNWPEDRAAEARSLLSMSQPARTLLKRAEELEVLLAGLPEQDASVLLKARIVAQLPDDPWQLVRDFLRGSLWRPALVATLPLLVGFVIGLNQSIQEPDLTTDEMTVFALSSSYEEFADGQ